MTEELTPPDVFETLDDEYARAILVATADQRLSARELSEVYGMSRATVSRRVNALVEQGFLSEHTHVAPDGHHYREYEARLERIDVELRADGFDVEISLRTDPADKLTRLFEGMQGD